MALEISLAPEVLTHIGSFALTNSMTVTVLIVILTLIGVITLRSKKMSLVPRGAYNVLEAFVEFWLETIDGITASRSLTLLVFPVVVSIFCFVALSNLIELIPGLGTIGIYGLHEGHVSLIPFVRSPSADLNFTLAIASCAILSTWILGIKQLGFIGHVSKFFTFKNPIMTFVGLLEFVGEFARVISFSFRLFGNIFAGEVLLAVISFLAPVIGGLPFLFLELFVGLVQALVFSMLTLVFIKIATESHTAH